MSLTPHKNCSHCAKPATTRCVRCKVHVYCNKSCQEQDEKSHQPRCEEIRLENALQRATTLNQNIYFAFREEAYDIDVIGAVEVNGYLSISQRRFVPGVFYKLPNDLLAPGADVEIKKAVLSNLACDNVLAMMYDTIGKSMQGLDVKIEEVSLDLKNVPRKTITSFPEESDSRVLDNTYDLAHRVIRITSTLSQKQYAVDLTGPQYGIYRILWEWDDYAQRYVEEVNRSLPFGRVNEYEHACSALDGSSALHSTANLEAATEVQHAIEKWAEAWKTDLASVLTEDEDVFDVKQKSLLDAVRDGMRRYMEAADFRERLQQAYNYDLENPGVTAQEISELTNRMLKGGDVEA